MSRMSRRHFLKGTAAAAVLLSAGGVLRAADQGVFSTGQGPAYAAWQDWNEEAEGEPPLIRLVQAAVLASSAHNTQPWLYRMEGQSLLLYADLSRNMGAMDPLLREMYFSLGCALENMVLAAAAYGYRADISLHSGGMEHILCATVALQEGAPSGDAASGLLFSAIGLRHTNRGAYDRKRPIDAQTLMELDQLAAAMPAIRTVWLTEPEAKSAMARLITAATEAVIADGEQARASHSWYRQDWNEVQRHKDGPTMDATGNGVFTRIIGKLLPVSAKTSDAYWLKMTRELQVPSAAAFGTITIKDRSNRTQLITAGRLWQRMHLWAAANGLAMQPLNQPHERRDREIQLGLPKEFGEGLAKLVHSPGYEGVFTFRIGYPLDHALASPRRPAAEVLLPY